MRLCYLRVLATFAIFLKRDNKFWSLTDRTKTVLNDYDIIIRVNLLFIRVEKFYQCEIFVLLKPKRGKNEHDRETNVEQRTKAASTDKKKNIVWKRVYNFLFCWIPRGPSQLILQFKNKYKDKYQKRWQTTMVRFFVPCYMFQKYSRCCLSAFLYFWYLFSNNKAERMSVRVKLLFKRGENLIRVKFVFYEGKKLSSRGNRETFAE